MAKVWDVDSEEGFGPEILNNTKASFRNANFEFSVYIELRDSFEEKPHVFYKSKRLCERNKLRKVVSYYLDNIFINKQSATYNKLKPTYWGYSLLAEKALIVDL